MDNTTPKHVAIYTAYKRGLLALEEARAHIIGLVIADPIVNPAHRAWAASRISRLLLRTGVAQLRADAGQADQLRAGQPGLHPGRPSTRPQRVSRPTASSPVTPPSPACYDAAITPTENAIFDDYRRGLLSPREAQVQLLRASLACDTPPLARPDAGATCPRCGAACVWQHGAYDYIELIDVATQQRHVRSCPVADGAAMRGA